MTAIISNFGLAAMLSAVVIVVTVVAAALVFARARLSGRPALGPTARVAAIGSACLIFAATAAPYSWPLERYGWGDLILELGRGGLRDLARFLDAPNSLAAMLAVANVALYVLLTFSAALGWPPRGAAILGAALVISLTVETLQFVVLDRVAATDDVVLNMSGAIIGLALGLMVRRALPARRTTEEP